MRKSICTGEPVWVLILAASLGIALQPTTARGQAAPPAGQQATAASPAAPPAVGPEEVVMTVGSRKITAAEFEKIVANLPPQFSGAMATMGKKGFADQYANLLGLVMEGEKRQIDQKEDFRKMVEFQRFVMLAQITLSELTTGLGAISADEINYFYTTHAGELQQLKLRGIYIPFEAERGPAAAGGGAGAAGGPARASGPGKPALTEAQALAKAAALKNRIQAGEDLAALAKAESAHSNASQGGDFGYVKRNQFAPQIDSVIFSLQPKQVSPPLRDRFGYYVFRLEEKRVQPLEEVRPAIENNLRQQKLDQALVKVKTDYPVTLDPRYFPDTPPPAPPTLGTPVSPPR